ncbi:hypothetical protein GCM10017779_58090 [Streptomyces capillispiralis]|nr:hypothetical protein GCM10017779_58090 [Streptomyces capillispiralis]
MCPVACAPADTPPLPRTGGRRKALTVPAPGDGPRHCDANAPPQRAPEIPNAPSTAMVEAEIHREGQGSFFGQFEAVRPSSNTLRAGSAHRWTVARSGRRCTPPGPFRRPRG